MCRYAAVLDARWEADTRGMATRNRVSVGLFLLGLLLVVLGFSALSSGGGEDLCELDGGSIGRVFAGECGGISVVGGALLLVGGAASFVVSARLRPRQE